MWVATSPLDGEGMSTSSKQESFDDRGAAPSVGDECATLTSGRRTKSDYGIEWAGRRWQQAAMAGDIGQLW
ncbi:conserved hypothetical protein [Ricinus communis]|uniref:Uncharacterized protein n=1 Tax=Ricinus communis TaxID=3988 RepID=B9SEX0_RICCO|nr:conserved hypothetical protein [Ricinus communis]